MLDIPGEVESTEAPWYKLDYLIPRRGGHVILLVPCNIPLIILSNYSYSLDLSREIYWSDERTLYVMGAQILPRCRK